MSISNFDIRQRTSTNILSLPKHARLSKVTRLVSSLFLLLSIASALPALGADQPTKFGRIELRADSTIVPGAPFTLSIYLTDTTILLGGFDLLLEFDFGALVLDSATLGQHTAGQWEYFTSRSDLQKPQDSASTAGFVRLLAIADNQDAANKHPDPLSLKGPGEIVRLHFYASDRKEFRGVTTNLRFLWNKCSDNSISDQSGNQLYLADRVVGDDGQSITLEHYSGPGAKCLSTGRNAPVKAFGFKNRTLRFRD